MSSLREVVGIVPLLLICVASWCALATWTGEWRRSLALSTIAIGVLVGAGTELLSLLDAVNVAGLCTLYGSYAIVVFIWWRRLVRSGAHVPDRPWATLRNPWAAVSTFYGAVLLLVAVVSPPNNWDSMTYHMARVAHWEAQGNVSYYATHIDRQLFLQPLAEYGILHTYIMSGGDRWANVVQWAAMVMTVIMVTLIARNIGLSRRVQAAAAVIVVTLPMGVTEATTTQNDYVAAMWIAVLAALVTDTSGLAVGGRGAFLVGSVAGLAMMTKGTTYFFLAPLLLWWLFRSLDLRPATVGRAVVVAALPALILATPGFYRNEVTFSRPFGPPLNEFVNQPIGPQATAENLIRHVAMQFGVPPDEVNRRTTQMAVSGASMIGLDLNRDGSTFPPGYQFIVTLGLREDDSQALGATGLLGVGVIVLLITSRGRRVLRRTPLLPLGVCAVAGAVLVEAYFRWNPWNARYLLPFFVLTSLVSAVALEQVPRWLRTAGLATLAASSLLWLFQSDLRPILRHDSILVTPREDQYFAARPELQSAYDAATSDVRAMHPSVVGYVGNADDWEYPLWVLLNKGGSNVVLESVSVSNPSRRYEGQLPDIVVCTTVCQQPSDDLGWQVQRYGSLSVWRRS